MRISIVIIIVIIIIVTIIMIIMIMILIIKINMAEGWVRISIIHHQLFIGLISCFE